jgi:hypothetical protein
MQPERVTTETNKSAERKCVIDSSICPLRHPTISMRVPCAMRRTKTQSTD